MKNHESAIMIAAIGAIVATMISFPVVFGLMFQAHEAQAQSSSEGSLKFPVTFGQREVIAKLQ
jgi:hypothetical protein